MSMSNIIPTIDDFPHDRANCGNCTRKGGACPRNKSNKQHNGLLFGYNKEIAGNTIRMRLENIPFVSE